MASEPMTKTCASEKSKWRLPDKAELELPPAPSGTPGPHSREEAICPRNQLCRRLVRGPGYPGGARTRGSGGDPQRSSLVRLNKRGAGNISTSWGRGGHSLLEMQSLIAGSPVLRTPGSVRQASAVSSPTALCLVLCDPGQVRQCSALVCKTERVLTPQRAALGIERQNGQPWLTVQAR